MSPAGKILAALLCLSVLAPVFAEEASIVHELRLRPQFRTRDGNEFRHKLLPTELTYMFWMKPGHLYPKWRQNSFELQRVHGSRDSFVINADAWTDRLDELAQPLNAWFTRKGFSIEPAETRIAVIHMSVFGTVTRRYIGDYSALFASLREVEMLYVDRPCRIAGSDGDGYTIDATLAAPGFHLLAATPTSTAEKEPRLAPAPAAAELDLLTVF
jgi:hypothetical protein